MISETKMTPKTLKINGHIKKTDIEEIEEINNNDIVNTKKRHRSDDEDDDDDDYGEEDEENKVDDYCLEDDDYDLLEENLGVSVKRKRYKRLKLYQTDESDDDRDAIANEIFDNDDDEIPNKPDKQKQHRQQQKADSFDSDKSEDDYSDFDNFIDDDDDDDQLRQQQIDPLMTNDALREARDIFGIDFDYGEFKNYGDDSCDDNNEEDEEENDIDYDNDDRINSIKYKSKKKKENKSIFDVYDPCELNEAYFTDIDKKIRLTDIPERMQLRSVPITSVDENSDELNNESIWIYQYAFNKQTISIQDDINIKNKKKGKNTIEKIKNALNFMRNEKLEVPYIGYYKKDYILPELDINDLWKIYKFDAKWCQLLERKNNLLKLYLDMYEYQKELIKKNTKYLLSNDIRIIKNSDIDRLKNVETNEELNDIYQHFILYYSDDIPKMKELLKKRNSKEKYDIDNDIEEMNIENEVKRLKKRAKNTGPYSFYKKSGLGYFAKKFGLTPEEFAENLANNYQNNKIKQELIEPDIIANNYLKNTSNNKNDIINAVKHMVAIQLSREPLLRKCIRKIYIEHAKLTVKPTKIGIKMIDESHPVYTMMYLKNKPVNTLIGDQFLKLILAEEDKLITIKMSDIIDGYTSDNYIDEIKKLYINNNNNNNCIEKWNNIRQSSVEIALNNLVIPSIKNELKTILINEAKDNIMRACCKKLHDWIKIAPYKCNDNIFEDINDDDDDDDWNTNNGIRVMAISYVSDPTQAGFMCIVTPNGDCTDYLKLPHILKRENTWRYINQKMKKNELNEIRNFILIKKPHVIAISGESIDAKNIFEDIKNCITYLMQNNDNFPDIPIEIFNNHISKIYSNSKLGINEFNNYSIILREAISLARYIQNPIKELSRFCTNNEEILLPYYHPLQKQLSKDDLIENLYIEFINRVNEIGVDINIIIKNNYNDNLLQFICGLGPRKSLNIIKILKNNNKYLENRTQLMTICNIDEIVYKNCCGFIKIDPNNINYYTDNFIEILDSSRIHPDDYDFARRMALDILEYDDENVTKALEEILNKPNILEDLDLDTYAEQIIDECGQKRLTLEDIRIELYGFFKDKRIPYEKPDCQELFNLLTKETENTFYIGKKIDGFIIKINKKKPIEEQREEIHPVRNDKTRLWECSYCNNNEFIELSDVWNHIDNEECPGKLTGIKIKLDNGLIGFIKIKNMYDDDNDNNNNNNKYNNQIKNVPDNLQINTPITCRIIDINIEKFNVECSIKKSDIDDINNTWSLKKDDYYDIEEENIIKNIEKNKKIQENIRVYHIRIITNKYFKNINYPEAENIMKHHSTKQGDAVIRPSSKGCDHLTITWKVTDNVFHHIDIKEEDKPNSFSVGRKLFIGTHEFDDLYEIMTNYVKPLAENAATIINYKYYKSNVLGCQNKANIILKKQQIDNPKYIPYILSVYEKLPTYFMISYLPHNKTYHEYIQITPYSFIFRDKEFNDFKKLLKWFKEYYNQQNDITHTLRGLCNVKNKNLIQKVTEKMSDTSMKSLSSLINQSPINYTTYKPAVTGYSGTNKYIDDLYTPIDEKPKIDNNNNNEKNKTNQHSLFDPDFW